MLTLGAHLSIAKGFTATAQTAIDIDGNTFQFFTRNPRGSSVKTYATKDLQTFAELRKAHNFGPLLAHAPYTLNLASGKPQTYEFALQVLAEDIRRMDKIDIEYLVTHTGNHTGDGLEVGMQRIIDALNQVLTAEQKIIVLLETMSGKGSEIGYRFEQLREIIDQVEHTDKLGICFDTCHVFSAGYDIVNNLDGVLAEFDNIIGLERLKAIHLNDSMLEFNSRNDRHAAIGKGTIGQEALTRLVYHPKLTHLPFYLETPHDDVAGYAAEIALLKQAGVR